MNENELLYNIEIEQALLSIILIEPNTLINVIDKLKPNNFYDPRNKLIYQKMLKISNKNVKILIDLNVLVDELKINDELETIGGMEYINEITNKYIMSSTYEVYVDKILEYSKKRMINDISKYITTSLFKKHLPTDELLDNVQNYISNIYNQNSENSLIDINTLITRHIEEYEKFRENNQKIDRPLTKFKRYDQLTSGLREGNMLILAARPSVGKTAFCLNIALNVAKQNNKNVLIFSLEMGEEELLYRLLSIESGIKLENITNNSFVSNGKEELQRYSKALSTLSQLNLFIDATATPTIEKIKNTCRNIQKSSKKIDFIVIDYLQLISGSSRSNSREQEIAEISRGLKLLAKELKVPILALSQLSRKVDNRENKKPILSDLRESGSIEQDADQVMFLYNANYHNANKDVFTGEKEGKKLESIELILAKHRNGQTGSILLLFDKDIQTFRNPTPEQESAYFSREDEK